MTYLSIKRWIMIVLWRCFKILVMRSSQMRCSLTWKAGIQYRYVSIIYHPNSIFFQCIQVNSHILPRKTSKFLAWTSTPKTRSPSLGSNVTWSITPMAKYRFPPHRMGGAGYLSKGGSLGPKPTLGVQVGRNNAINRWVVFFLFFFVVSVPIHWHPYTTASACLRGMERVPTRD